MERYYNASEDIMDEVYNDEGLWRKLVPESYSKSFLRRVGEWFANIFTTVDRSKGAIEAAEEVIVPFASRAYRRFLEKEEVDKVLGLFRKVYEGTSGSERYDIAIRETMKAILVSPNFLYRYEEELPVPVDHPYPISNFELASRLSYFLWNTLPDQ